MALSSYDVIDITQLYARYCHAVDDGDGKSFSGCFTDDGVLNVGSGEPVSGGEALAAFSAGLPALVPGIRHIVNNIVLEGGNGAANGGAYLTVQIVGAEPKVLMTGRYRDQLRREGNSWLFARRDLTQDT